MSAERVEHPSVWCALWLSEGHPNNIGTPGYIGRGGELCNDCHKRFYSEECNATRPTEQVHLHEGRALAT